MPHPRGKTATPCHLPSTARAIIPVAISRSRNEKRNKTQSGREPLAIEEQVLHTIFETSPDAIVVIDAHGIVQSFNPMAEKMFGYEAADVRGKNVKILMPPYFADRHDGYMERYLRTGEKRIIGIGRIVTGQRKDGSTFPIELAIGEAAAGDDRLFTGFIRDLTERQEVEQRVHEMQEELLHASRLASLGEVSSMIAHEANQPLSAAGTYLEIARELLGDGREAGEGGIKALDQAAAQVRRVGETIRRIREFAKRKTPELAAEDGNRIVEEAYGIASVGSKSKAIKTIFELDPALPPVRADRIQIQQVVMNLVRNAIEAMAEEPRRELRLRTRLRGADLAEISIIDTGHGIGKETAQRLFAPFMTTKKDGTGLGLAICKSIVEAHGGALWYESADGGGSAFVFTLPIERPGLMAVSRDG
jgi:two-component system sensor kinase FixL